MAVLESREETYFCTVRGFCRTCEKAAPARVFLRDGAVWQQSLCTCGISAPALIASDASWYMAQIGRPRPDHSPLVGAKPSLQGCPYDCGPCTWHASPCQLPVVSATNACNLDCPICFTYNRKDRLFFMSTDQMRRTVDWIVESSGPVDLINVTGGEPTLHPRILDLLEECRRPEIGRVTMNSNGLVLARDMDLCRRLADLEVCVVLSFSTFDRECSVRLHGKDVVADKLQALENLRAAGVRTTLLQVMVRGENEEAAGGLLKLLRGYENVLSLTVQTMTYTGQGGGTFPGRAHLPVDEAARVICGHSDGELEMKDFFPRPSAHPLCYALGYFLVGEGRLLPFTRFIPAERIEGFLSGSYLIRMTDDESLFREGIAGLYAQNDVQALRLFRGLVEKLFPSRGQAPGAFERQKIAESAVRTIYIHAHMDEDTFDCSRAMLCPDLVPAEPGRLVPACTYNLIYRRQDERFYAQ